MTLKIKLVLALLVSLLAFGSIAYFYVYKQHRDISLEQSAYELSANDLVSEFSSNKEIANSKYVDQTISIYGKVTALDLAISTIIINNKISAVLFKDQGANLVVGQKIIIKGRLVGFDDLFEEIKMDQCSVN